ncbi:MAG: glycoside hydrolase family 18 protein [Bythopirellula sp.]|nr:glycoside hydrolase family 18 protein [Bythopirellula sp.]
MRPRAKAIALLGFFIALCQPAFAATVENAENKVFVGYVSGMPKEIHYKLYTHLCHAFVVAEKDGTLIPQENVPNHELAREAHQAGVEVLVSLGGWGWDEKFAAMSLDPLAEDRYVSAVMNLVDKFDYDGIDLDWEYPDTNIEIVGFERLARRFRQALDELGKKRIAKCC